ncbi:hypothetical protein [Flavihumibacter solisilvae]|uniref:Beta-lactamase-inhibitor-like PepSY-like domain-containing protein n=1 Tax=Flavihumibacter solisilvae TaxID=1349421 RepID=A0A0C1IG33_9BACT|nr:hypothetical protein [Flavihumibacter solisilvae]KIC93115.1 hypothetical protein OI18_18990 [Flavihumibacter solisilvae]
MKKSFFILVLAVLAYGSKAVAQGGSGDFDGSVAKLDATGKKVAAPKVSSSRVYKDFSKRFHAAEDVVWYETPKGFIASFSADGIKTHAEYDKRGQWITNILSYPESKLDREIRRMVLSNYIDYNITWVNEVQLNDRSIYLVQVFDGQNTLHLKISEGEMETIARYHAKP